MAQIQNLDALLQTISNDEAVKEVKLHGFYGQEYADSIKLIVEEEEPGLLSGVEGKSTWTFEAKTVEQLIEKVEQTVVDVCN